MAYAYNNMQTYPIPQATHRGASWIACGVAGATSSASSSSSSSPVLQQMTPTIFPNRGAHPDPQQFSSAVVAPQRGFNETDVFLHSSLQREQRTGTASVECGHEIPVTARRRSRGERGPPGGAATLPDVRLPDLPRTPPPLTSHGDRGRPGRGQSQSDFAHQRGAGSDYSRSQYGTGTGGGIADHRVEQVERQRVISQPAQPAPALGQVEVVVEQDRRPLHGSFMQDSSSTDRWPRNESAHPLPYQQNTAVPGSPSGSVRSDGSLCSLDDVERSGLSSCASGPAHGRHPSHPSSCTGRRATRGKNNRAAAVCERSKELGLDDCQYCANMNIASLVFTADQRREEAYHVQCQECGSFTCRQCFWPPIFSDPDWRALGIENKAILREIEQHGYRCDMCAGWDPLLPVCVECRRFPAGDDSCDSGSLRQCGSCRAMICNANCCGSGPRPTNDFGEPICKFCAELLAQQEKTVAPAAAKLKYDDWGPVLLDEVRTRSVWQFREQVPFDRFIEMFPFEKQEAFWREHHLPVSETGLTLRVQGRDAVECQQGRHLSAPIVHAVGPDRLALRDGKLLAVQYNTFNFESFSHPHIPDFVKVGFQKCDGFPRNFRQLLFWRRLRQQGEAEQAITYQIPGQDYLPVESRDLLARFDANVAANAASRGLCRGYFPQPPEAIPWSGFGKRRMDVRRMFPASANYALTDRTVVCLFREEWILDSELLREFPLEEDLELAGPPLLPEPVAEDNTDAFDEHQVQSATDGLSSLSLVARMENFQVGTAPSSSASSSQCAGQQLDTAFIKQTQSDEPSSIAGDHESSLPLLERMNARFSNSDESGLQRFPLDKDHHNGASGNAGNYVQDSHGQGGAAAGGARSFFIPEVLQQNINVGLRPSPIGSPTPALAAFHHLRTRENTAQASARQKSNYGTWTAAQCPRSDAAAALGGVGADVFSSQRSLASASRSSQYMDAVSLSARSREENKDDSQYAPAPALAPLLLGRQVLSKGWTIGRSHTNSPPRNSKMSMANIPSPNRARLKQRSEPALSRSVSSGAHQQQSKFTSSPKRNSFLEMFSSTIMERQKVLGYQIHSSQEDVFDMLKGRRRSTSVSPPASGNGKQATPQQGREVPYDINTSVIVREEEDAQVEHVAPEDDHPHTDQVEVGHDDREVVPDETSRPRKTTDTDDALLGGNKLEKMVELEPLPVQASEKRRHNHDDARGGVREVDNESRRQLQGSHHGIFDAPARMGNNDQRRHDLVSRSSAVGQVDISREEPPVELSGMVELSEMTDLLDGASIIGALAEEVDAEETETSPERKRPRLMKLPANARIVAVDPISPDSQFSVVSGDDHVRQDGSGMAKHENEESMEHHMPRGYSNNARKEEELYSARGGPGPLQKEAVAPPQHFSTAYLLRASESFDNNPEVRLLLAQDQKKTDSTFAGDAGTADHAPQPSAEDDVENSEHDEQFEDDPGNLPGDPGVVRRQKPLRVRPLPECLRIPALSFSDLAFSVEHSVEEPDDSRDENGDVAKASFALESRPASPLETLHRDELRRESSFSRELELILHAPYHRSEEEAAAANRSPNLSVLLQSSQEDQENEAGVGEPLAKRRKTKTSSPSSSAAASEKDENKGPEAAKNMNLISGPGRGGMKSSSFGQEEDSPEPGVHPDYRPIPAEHTCYTEVVDVHTLGYFVRELQFAPRTDPASRKYLAQAEELLAVALRHEGRIPMSYHRPKGMGRRYADHKYSLQHVSKLVRAAACGHLATDVDLQNCYPTLLVQLLDKPAFAENLAQVVKEQPVAFREGHGLPDGGADPLAMIRLYTTNGRENCLKRIQNYYNVTREDAKELLLRLLYGGGIDAWKQHCGSAVPGNHGFVRRFEQEANVCMEVVARSRPDLLQLFSGRQHPKRTLLSYVIGELEDAVLFELERVIAATNGKYQVSALCFDGMLVYHNQTSSFLDSMAEELPQLLLEAERIVQLKLGYTVRFEIKPLAVRLAEATAMASGLVQAGASIQQNTLMQFSTAAGAALGPRTALMFGGNKNTSNSMHRGHNPTEERMRRDLAELDQRLALGKQKLLQAQLSRLREQAEAEQDHADEVAAWRADNIELRTKVDELKASVEVAEAAAKTAKGDSFKDLKEKWSHVFETCKRKAKDRLDEVLLHQKGKLDAAQKLWDKERAALLREKAEQKEKLDKHWKALMEKQASIANETRKAAESEARRGMARMRSAIDQANGNVAKANVEINRIWAEGQAFFEENNLLREQLRRAGIEPGDVPDNIAEAIGATNLKDENEQAAAIVFGQSGNGAVSRQVEEKRWAPHPDHQQQASAFTGGSGKAVRGDSDREDKDRVPDTSKNAKEQPSGMGRTLLQNGELQEDHKPASPAGAKKGRGRGRPKKAAAPPAGDKSKAALAIAASHQNADIKEAAGDAGNGISSSTSQSAAPQDWSKADEKKLAEAARRHNLADVAYWERVSQDVGRPIAECRARWAAKEKWEVKARGNKRSPARARGTRGRSNARNALMARGDAKEEQKVQPKLPTAPVPAPSASLQSPRESRVRDESKPGEVKDAKPLAIGTGVSDGRPREECAAPPVSAMVSEKKDQEALALAAGTAAKPKLQHLQEANKATAADAAPAAVSQSSLQISLPAINKKPQQLISQKESIKAADVTSSPIRRLGGVDIPEKPGPKRDAAVQKALLQTKPKEDFFAAFLGPPSNKMKPPAGRPPRKNGSGGTAPSSSSSSSSALHAAGTDNKTPPGKRKNAPGTKVAASPSMASSFQFFVNNKQKKQEKPENIENSHDHSGSASTSSSSINAPEDDDYGASSVTPSQATPHGLVADADDIDKALMAGRPKGVEKFKAEFRKNSQRFRKQQSLASLLTEEQESLYDSRPRSQLAQKEDEKRLLKHLRKIDAKRAKEKYEGDEFWEADKNNTDEDNVWNDFEESSHDSNGSLSDGAENTS
ncbi:unnamed protein product [Amoebophrya sp. A120]|nr:unnamed protein product [Amoebophrya sp. A120]|eukprot:GSA120T00006704001.1